MSKTLSTFADTARAWVMLRRHTLVVGPAGSGRSLVIARAQEQLRMHGFDTVHVDGAYDDLRAMGTFTSHPTARALTPERRDIDRLADVYIEELDRDRAVLIVERIDLLSAESTAFVSRLLRESRAVLLASSGRRGDRTDSRGLPLLLAEFAVSEVQLEPLGYAGVSALLTDHLGASPDAPLISALAARAGGNAKVVTAIADGARLVGAITLHEGLWTEASPLDAVPLSAVTNILTGQLTPRELNALQQLCIIGDIPIGEAIRFIDPDVIQRLSDASLITSRPSISGPRLAVSPPALRTALLQSLTPAGRALHLRTITDALGENPLEGANVTEEIRNAFGDESGNGLSWTGAADVVALVQESGRAQRMAALSRWRSDRSIPAAVAVAEAMLGRVPSPRLAEVFRESLPDEAESVDVVSRFLMYRLQYGLVNGAHDSPDDSVQPFERRGDLQELSAMMQFFVLLRRGAQLPTAVLPASPPKEPYVRGWWVVARASESLEKGDARAVLDLLDETMRVLDDPQLDRCFEALEADALFLLGELEAIERSARSRLAVACEELDGVGIRVHAILLGWALYHQGRVDEAWEPLSLALRLGRPGPFIPSYYSRLLALATAVQLELGNHELVKILDHESSHYSRSLRQPFGNLERWLDCKRLRASHADAEADELAWSAGLEEVVRGFPVTGMMLWAERIAPLSTEQTIEVVKVLESTPKGMYHDILSLHVAYSSADESGIREGLEKACTRSYPVLVQHAARRLTELRAARGHHDADPFITAILTDEPRTLRSWSATAARALSDREREVALLARSGLSNREISTRLYVSVRTVENHMYRALRKLGLERRSELETGWDPSLT